MLIGSHESVAGGLERAFQHAEKHRGEAVQIFTKNSNQWKEPVLARSQIEAFRAAHRAWGGGPVIAHESYLVNLCAERDDVAVRSRDAIVSEMERCEELGVSFVAFHPGASLTAHVDDALTKVGEGLSEVLDRTRGFRVRLCIENTAGQGSSLGSSLDEIAALLDRTSGGRERLGVCLDTQHLFAAGYDLRNGPGYEAFFREFDSKIGLSRLCCFHLNDSKKPLGQRVDRHEEIGVGEIGLYPFFRLVNDPRFAAVPAVLELPPEVADTNLERLRGLHGAEEPAQKRIIAPLTLTPPEPASPRAGKRSTR
jgi:deoxyribonuclease-4